MSAGVNSGVFEQMVGKEALDLILNAVRCDSINRQKMLDIAGDFGREVRGRHTKRMARQVLGDAFPNRKASRDLSEDKDRILGTSRVNRSGNYSWSG